MLSIGSRLRFTKQLYEVNYTMPPVTEQHGFITALPRKLTMILSFADALKKNVTCFGKLRSVKRIFREGNIIK